MKNTVPQPSIRSKTSGIFRQTNSLREEDKRSDNSKKTKIVGNYTMH